MDFHFYISRVHTKTRVLEYKHYLYLLDKVGVMSKDQNIKIGHTKCNEYKLWDKILV